MSPFPFHGSRQIAKLPNMTDEQCLPIWADIGVDINGFPYFLTAWKPSYEDIQAINRGEPIYIKTITAGLPPMSLFTLDENGKCNDAG